MFDLLSLEGLGFLHVYVVGLGRVQRQLDCRIPIYSRV